MWASWATTGLVKPRFFPVDAGYLYVRAERGEILLKEVNVAGNEDWKQYTAAYLDEGFLINYLTPEEYFYFVGRLHNRSKADVDETLNTLAAFFGDGHT